MNACGHKGVVVVGGHITGLSAVRALATSGVPVALIVDREHDLASYSCWAKDCHTVPALHQKPEDLLELLEHQASRWRGWALLPAGDIALELLSQHREYLSRWYTLTAPPHEVASRLLSKDLTYSAAREVGVDLPRIYGSADPKTAASTEVTFPVVVKPLDGQRFWHYFQQKLFVARDRAELHNAVGRLLEAGLCGQIQDLVPGLDDRFFNYSVFLNAQGDPVAEFGMHKLRKSPPHFGTCRAAEPMDLPELREPTIELLRHIGWRGMANAEFKQDPRDGRFRLMEVNGRGFLMQGLAWRAGINYPLLAFREAVLGEEVRAGWNGWNGVWINLLADMYYAAFYRQEEGLGLGSYLSSYQRPKTFAIWSRSDPWPFFARLAGAFRKAGRLTLVPSERADLRRRVRQNLS